MMASRGFFAADAVPVADAESRRQQARDQISEHCTILLGDAGALLPKRTDLEAASDEQRWGYPGLRATSDILSVLTRHAAIQAALAREEVETPLWREDEISNQRVVRTSAAQVYLGADDIADRQEYGREPQDFRLNTPTHRAQYHAAQLAGLMSMVAASNRISQPSPQLIPGLRTDHLGIWGVGNGSRYDVKLLCPQDCRPSRPKIMREAIRDTVADLATALGDYMKLALNEGAPEPSNQYKRLLPAHVLARIVVLCSGVTVAGQPLDVQCTQTKGAESLAKQWCKKFDLMYKDSSPHKAVPVDEDVVEWFGRVFQHLLFVPHDVILSDEMISFAASLWADSCAPEYRVRSIQQALQRFEDPNISPTSRKHAPALYQELVRVLSWCATCNSAATLPLHAIAARRAALTRRPEERIFILDSAVHSGLERALAEYSGTGQERLRRIQVVSPVWFLDSDPLPAADQEAAPTRPYVAAWLCTEYELTADAAGNPEYQSTQSCVDLPGKPAPEPERETPDPPSVHVFKIHGSLFPDSQYPADLGTNTGRPKLLPRIIVSEDRFARGFFAELATSGRFPRHSNLLQSRGLNSTDLLVLGFNMRRPLSRTDFYSLLSSICHARESSNERSGKALVHHVQEVSEHAEDLVGQYMSQAGMHPPEHRDGIAWAIETLGKEGDEFRERLGGTR